MSTPDATRADLLAPATGSGCEGSYGANDDGYINAAVRRAAVILRGATDLWSEGHYAHSNARMMPAEHPLARALACLAETDKETARYANTTHDPALFAPHMPSEEAQHRWDGCEGTDGESQNDPKLSDGSMPPLVNPTRKP
jgi:hypothetical protein